MKYKKIILILILVIILLLLCFYYNKTEYLDASGLTPVSNEALQHISSLYNNQQVLSNNLKILQTGEINNIKSESINSESINSKSITTTEIISPKICFDATNCLDKSAVGTLLLISSPINDYMYLPNQCVIWSDLNPYINKEIIAKNTTFDMAYNTAKWNEKNIYRTITQDQRQSNGTGIEITVPNPPSGSNYDYTVLWIQTLNDRWSDFKIYNNTPYKTFGKYSTGLRRLNSISPNGAMHNERWEFFEWYPVPIKLNADRKIMISNFRAGSPTWFSGFAFSTNPWNHCRISALSLHWQTNKDTESDIDGGNSALAWDNDNWNNDPLIRFPPNTQPSFQIPFVNSGKDKIFYIIEHNSNWGPGIVMASAQKADNTYQDIGGLYTTFNNPFSRHFTSKLYQRYYGVIIPKNLLPTDKDFITIRVSMPKGGTNLYVREVGTHDYNPLSIQ